MVTRGRRGASGEEPPEEVVRALAEAKHRVAGIEEWKLEHWLEAITRMRRLSAERHLGLHDPGNPNIFDLPCGPSLVGGVGQVGRETVKVIERRPLLEVGERCDGPYIVYPDVPNEKVHLRGVGHLIPHHDLPAMIVSLEGTDEHILAEVERVLQKRRNIKASNALPRTPGRRSLSRFLSSGHAGRKWQKYRVVELVEMLAWNAARGRRYAQNRIGFWIDSENLGTDRKTSEATAVARQAISALPALLAEVEKVGLPG